MTYYFWAVCKTTFSLPIYIFDKLNARTTLRWSEIDFAVIRCSCSLLKRNNFKYFSLVFVEDKTENFVTRTFRSFDRSREYHIMNIIVLIIREWKQIDILFATRLPTHAIPSRRERIWLSPIAFAYLIWIKRLELYVVGKVFFTSDCWKTAFS